MRQDTMYDTVRMPWNLEAQTEDDAQPCRAWSHECSPPGGTCPLPQTIGRLHGIVVDIHGRPVPDFLVVAHWRPLVGCVTSQLRSELGRTDGRGEYSFDLPMCGHALVSFDEDAAFYRLSDFEDTLEPGEEDLPCEWFEPVQRDRDLEWPETRVRHVGHISGHVLDESGAPVSDVTVLLMSSRHAHDGISMGYWARTKTDGTGQFVLSGLKCLNGSLVFSAVNGRSHQTTELTLGNESDGSDICLRHEWVCQDLRVVLTSA